MKEEESLGTGDPKFPKIIWPPKQSCSSCYQSQSDEWNNDEVYKFLTNYYRKSLVSVYKDKDLVSNQSTYGAGDESAVNALVVPVGAALAIALASCAFGALACYWRSQQKSRKYYHQLHSLKNI